MQIFLLILTYVFVIKHIVNSLQRTADISELVPLPTNSITNIPRISIALVQEPSAPEQLVILQDNPACGQVVFYENEAAAASGEAQADGDPTFNT